MVRLDVHYYPHVTLYVALTEIICLDPTSLLYGFVPITMLDE